MHGMRFILFFLVSCAFAQATPLAFTGKGTFSVKGYSGLISLSEGFYDANLHWGTGTGSVFECEIVDAPTNRISIRTVSSNKYLFVPNLEDSEVETSKLRLVALSPGAIFDKTNLNMQFYIEAADKDFKIRSVATGGYLVASTGAVVRASQLGNDGKYSVLASKGAGFTVGFAIQPRPMNLKEGSTLRIKEEGGGYLGFNDSGNFVITPATDSAPIPEFRVASYDQATGTISLKVSSYSLSSVATPGSKYGGIPFSFEKSLINAPAQFLFATDPLVPKNCYLMLVNGQSKYYLRRSSSSPSAVIASIITDWEQVYKFSFEERVNQDNNILSGIKVLAIGAGSSLQLQSLSGDLLYITSDAIIGLGKRSLHDPASQFVVESYDSAQRVISIKNGSRYLDIDAEKKALKLSSTKVLLRVLVDADSKNISFLNSSGQVVSVASISGDIVESFKLINPIENSYQRLFELYQKMSQPLAREVLVDAFSGALKDFFLMKQKTQEDWMFFVDFLKELLIKASADIQTWKVPSVDIIEQGKARRVSLCEYAAIFVGYLADPFVLVPVEAQIKARVLQESLLAQLQQPTAVPVSGAFEVESFVTLQSGDSAKLLFVSNQGVAQMLPGLTRFNSSVHAQIVAYDGATKKIKLSYAGRFFDQANASFSITNAAQSPFFTLEPVPNSSLHYLSLGQGKRLVIGDKFSSGCSLDAQGTPFNILRLNDVYRSLPQVKVPATPQEFENSLKAYFAAFDLVRNRAEDMMFIFQELKKYCELVAVTPDWFLSMKGAVIANDSPLNYVKNSLQTILTLQARYVGLTDALKTLIQQFILGPSFVAMQVSSSLKEGALCYLRAGDMVAVALDNTGVCKPLAIASLLEPSIHAVVDRYDPAAATLSLSVNGKKITTDQTNKLISADVAGVFRFMTEPSGRQSLLNGQNKKLRYDQASQSIVFGDAGIIVEIAFMQPDQRVLGALSGDPAKDLKLFELVLNRMRSRPNELDFVVRKLILYAQQSSKNISWYTATGVDTKNPKVTMRDYASVLLKYVRDSASIFTAASPALKESISAAIKEIEDDGLLYARQIDSLDGLAKKLTEPSLITTSSELVSVLNGLIESVMTRGKAEQRDELMQKVQTYVDPAIVTGLLEASDTAKMAWNIQNIRFLDRLLLYTVQDVSAWQDKFELIKAKLFARLFDAQGSEKISLMQIILNSSVKKLLSEGVLLGVKSGGWRSLRQFLTNLLFDISQQLESAVDDATLASLRNVKKILDGLLVTAGMQQDSPAAQTEVVPDVTPAPAPVVIEQPVESRQPPARPRRALLSGMIGAAVQVDVGTYSPPKSTGIESSAPNKKVETVSLQRGISIPKYDI